MPQDPARLEGAVDEEAEIHAFLSAPGPLDGERIEVFETHCAVVFVGAREVLKIKRRVTYPYLDFSTLDRRRAACERELAVNRPAAPEIYLETCAITRQQDGRLAVAGNGRPVEWAVRMRRFEQSDLLSERVRAGALPPDLVKATADMVAGYHRQAAVAAGIDSAAVLASIADEVAREMARFAPIVAAERVAAWHANAVAHILKCQAVLARRSTAGCVRRCHGDLHLANIVVWHGRPVPFDAIEFDERLATIDTLYDLAFLLMDFDRSGLRGDANIVLNRVLWRTGSGLDVEGLAALPAMLSLRAGIRAFVTLTRSTLEPEAKRRRDEERGRATFAAAEGYLAVGAPCLVAIGGLSGSGKSTLAGSLAPAIGTSPGALHLRSDLERKAMLGAEEQQRLPASAYTADMSRRVYERVMQRAGLALAAGWPVIVDAAALHGDERQALARLAAGHGATFHGLWLEAPLDILRARVDRRRGDASDATAAVVEQQAAQVADAPREWTRIDASRPAGEVLEHAIAEVRRPR